MVSPDEHIDVSLLTYDDIAEIDLEVEEHELSLFQKFITVVEILMITYLFVYCSWATVDNIGKVVDIMRTSFIF